MMFLFYELLKTYATINMQKSFQKINIPKLPVLTTEQGIKLILDNISSFDEWNEITNLIPKITKNDKKMSKTNIAGLFSGSLELVKQGEINISQKKPFDKIFLKKI